MNGRSVSLNLPPDVVAAEAAARTDSGHRRRARHPRKPGGPAVPGKLSGGARRQRHRGPEAPGRQSSYDLVLLDLMMPDKSGMQVLEEIRARDRETPVFMITAYGSVEVAVDALKRGASDYFSKPWDNEKLLIEIDRMISKRRLERENTELKRALKQRYSFPNIVGKSERMLKILDLVAQVAASRATILITGETGTGKELIANAIHAHSARAEHPFVPVHSGSVPPDLLESALFGHVQGRLHRRGGVAQGIFRDRQPRHHFLRRDRHHFAGDADQAAARDSGARVHAAGFDRDHQGGRADRRRHQRRSEAAGGRRQIPRGSVLPAERDQSGAAAAARPQGRYSRAGRPFLHQILPRERKISG